MESGLGVYILRTPSSCRYSMYEYRIARLNFIGDINNCIVNARRLWRHTRVFTDRKTAFDVADDMAEKVAVLDYGIVEVFVNKEF